MAYASSDGFTFVLPPSLGRRSIRPVALRVAGVLSDVGFATVAPAPSYAELERQLSSGEAQAAWAPPLVCGRMLRLGGRMPLRAVRFGAASYRSALLCGSDRSVDLKRIGGATGLSPLRAVWVDPRSAAGCVAPRAHLRGLGADLGLALEESFAGSYQECFDAVLEGRAELTATYVGPRGSGHVDLCGDRASWLRVLAWTAPIPNDGIAISPALGRYEQDRVEHALRTAFEDARESLVEAFDADRFDEPEHAEYDDLEPEVASGRAGVARVAGVA